MNDFLKKTFNVKVIACFVAVMLLLNGCDSDPSANSNEASQKNSNVIVKNDENSSNNKDLKEQTNKEEKKDDPSTEEPPFEGYTLIEVDGGDLSGHREPKVVVDIGFGDREYYAFTNEHGQLVKVIAKEIILQDDKKEPVLSTGRYYADEAKVPGVESKTLDEGHVIADSLGGVSNAYNITPQNSTLNRHGDQAYMEKVIRDAGGCTDFVAIITYPNTTTQIPSHYSYTYTIKGNVINDEFDNVNPDEVNAKLEENIQTEKPKKDPVVEEVKKEDATSVIVYVTDTGSKYHRENCSSLKNSKHEKNLNELDNSYSPCKKCNPPTL